MEQTAYQKSTVKKLEEKNPKKLSSLVLPSTFTSVRNAKVSLLE